MATALIQGLLSVRVLPELIYVADPSVDAQQRLKGILPKENIYGSNKQMLLQNWDVCVLAVKPQKLPEVLELGLWMDPKSRFQESAQEIVGITPTYRVLKEHGPDHAKEFMVGVYLGDEKIADGSGGSKQEAQVEAAENALKAKAWKGPKTEILERTDGDPFG